MCRPRRQQLLFAIDQIRRIEGCKFEAVAMRDRIGRTSFHAITAKNAAVVVNVINLGVPLSATHPLLRRVLVRLNINAICRTVCSAQKTSDAFLQAVLISLQNMHAAVPLLDLRPPQGPWTI